MTNTNDAPRSLLERALAGMNEGDWQVWEADVKAFLDAPRSPAPLGWRDALDKISEGGPDIGPVMAKTGKEYRHGFDQGCAWAGRIARAALPVDGGLGPRPAQEPVVPTEEPSPPVVAPPSENALSALRWLAAKHSEGGRLDTVWAANWIVQDLAKHFASLQAENCKLGGDAEGVHQSAAYKQENR